MDPDARVSAGIQKRARNLAAEELLIEVIVVWVKVFCEKGMIISFAL